MSIMAPAFHLAEADLQAILMLGRLARDSFALFDPVLLGIPHERVITAVNNLEAAVAGHQAGDSLILAKRDILDLNSIVLAVDTDFIRFEVGISPLTAQAVSDLEEKIAGLPLR